MTVRTRAHARLRVAAGKVRSSVDHDQRDDEVRLPGGPMFDYVKQNLGILIYNFESTACFGDWLQYSGISQL